MTEGLHKTTQEMIVDYYTKTKRYSKSILFLAIVGVITIILTAVWVYQSRAKIDRQQTQIVTLQQQNIELQKIVNGRVSDVQSQISCVGEYFSKPNRGTIVIPDFKSCEIKRVK